MSFSSGFAEGLNSVNNIWRTINQQKNQNQNYSLRQADQAMRQHEFDQNAQFRRDSLDQQAQNHKDALEMQKEQLGLQRQVAGMNQQLRGAMLRMQQNQQQLAALQPVYQGAIQILSNGGTVPSEVLNKLSGTPFDLGAMSGTSYKSAIQSITDALSKNPDQINTKDNLKNLNLVLAPELNRGVGDIDPGNGKKLSGREITGIIPSPDGKLLSPRVKLTYADGTTAEGPLSKFGTTHNDDPLIAIPTETAGKQMFARKAAAALVSSSPNLKALGGSGKNTIRQAVAGKIADLEEKRVEADGKLRSGALGTDADSMKKLKDDLEANDKQYRDLEQRMYDVYGITPPGGDSSSGAGGDDSQRLSADKDFPAFRQAMAARKWDVDKLPTGQLGELLQQYKQSAAKNAKATSMADQMRQSYEKSGK